MSECDGDFFDNKGGGLEGAVAVVAKERGDFCLVERDKGDSDTAALEVAVEECNGSPVLKEEKAPLSPELFVPSELDGFSEVSDAGGNKDDGFGGSNGGGPLGSLGRVLTLLLLISVSSSSSSESVQ